MLSARRWIMFSNWQTIHSYFKYSIYRDRFICSGNGFRIRPKNLLQHQCSRGNKKLTHDVSSKLNERLEIIDSMEVVKYKRKSRDLATGEGQGRRSRDLATGEGQGRRHVPTTVSHRIRRDVFLNLSYADRIVTSRKSWIGMSPRSVEILRRTREIQTKRSNEIDLSNDVALNELRNFVSDVVNLPESEYDKESLSGVLIDECCRRIRTTDGATMLYFADAFYVMNVDSAKYVKLIVKEFDGRWNEVVTRKEDLLQILFSMSTTRSSSVFLMHRVEEFLAARANEFSIAELGLICHAFFATNTSIRNYATLERLSEIVVARIRNDDFKLYQLVNILKTLRHSQFAKLGFYEEVGDVLCGRFKERPDLRLKDASLSELSNIAFTFSSLRIVHSKLFKEIGKLVCDELSRKSDGRTTTIRMKDLSRLIWTFGTFSEPVPKFLLEKAKDLMSNEGNFLSTRYPESYLEALVAFAMNRIYPRDLISAVFSDNYLAMKSRRLLEQHFQLLLLNTSVQTECPHYKGNLLTQDFLKSCPKEVFGNLRYELRTRQGLLNLIRTLYSVFQHPAYLCTRFILPSSRITDVEMHLDSSNHPIKFDHVGAQDGIRAVHEIDNIQTESQFLNGDRTQPVISSTISQLIQSHQNNELRKMPENIHLKSRKEINEKSRRISIKVMGWNQYALNEPSLLGLHQMELRLLTETGYDVFVINPILAQQIDKSSSEERREIVMKILSQLGVCLPK